MSPVYSVPNDWSWEIKTNKTKLNKTNKNKTPLITQLKAS